MWCAACKTHLGHCDDDDMNQVDQIGATHDCTATPEQKHQALTDFEFRRIAHQEGLT